MARLYVESYVRLQIAIFIYLFSKQTVINFLEKVVHRRLQEDPCLWNFERRRKAFRRCFGELLNWFGFFSFFSSFSFKLNPILFRMTSCEIYYQLHRLQPGCNFGVARRLFPSTLYNSHRLQMIMKLRFNVRNVVLYVLFVPHPLIFSDIFSYYLRFRFDVAWGIWLPATEILEILSLRYNKHNKRETWAAKVGYRSGFRS